MIIALAMVGLIAIVLAAGRVHPWVRAHLGDAIVVIPIYFTAALVFPRSRPTVLAIGTFAFACLVEFSQLWHAEFLEAFRATTFGRLTIGHVFGWLDIVHYFAGTLAAWGMDERWVASRGRTHAHAPVPCP